MKHHTKDKGDKGVGFVIADLLKKGYYVSIPISEHLPFDLIAINSQGVTKKLSVKYRKVYRGIISVAFSNCYSDSKGFHYKPIDKKMIDVIAIYCENTNNVYYVNHNDFKKGVYLRVDKAKNNQTKGVCFADNYLELNF